MRLGHLVLQIIETIVQIGVKAPNLAHVLTKTHLTILAMETSQKFTMSATVGHFPKWPPKKKKIETIVQIRLKAPNLAH